MIFDMLCFRQNQTARRYVMNSDEEPDEFMIVFEDEPARRLCSMSWTGISFNLSGEKRFETPKAAMNYLLEWKNRGHFFLKKKGCTLESWKFKIVLVPKKK
jgi:hypothetical protein